MWLPVKISPHPLLTHFSGLKSFEKLRYMNYFEVHFNYVCDKWKRKADLRLGTDSGVLLVGND